MTGHSATGLLSDEAVQDLISQLTPSHRMFLAGLGLGMAPVAAAVRAGWKAEEAEKVALFYMTRHPVVAPLADHILRLRDLATLDGESSVLPCPPTVH